MSYEERWLEVKALGRRIAATVTRGAVRCSAWFGVAGVRERLPTTTGQNGESALRMREEKAKTVALSRRVKREKTKSRDSRKRWNAGSAKPPGSVKA
jgi:hypothetical protein